MSKPLPLTRQEQGTLVMAAEFGVDLKTAALVCLRRKADFIRALRRDRRLARRVAKSRRRGARLPAEMKAEAQGPKPRQWRQAARRIERQ